MVPVFSFISLSDRSRHINTMTCKTCKCVEFYSIRPISNKWLCNKNLEDDSTPHNWLQISLLQKMESHFLNDNFSNRLILENINKKIKKWKLFCLGCKSQTTKKPNHGDDFEGIWTGLTKWDSWLTPRFF